MTHERHDDDDWLWEIVDDPDASAERKDKAYRTIFRNEEERAAKAAAEPIVEDDDEDTIKLMVHCQVDEMKATELTIRREGTELNLTSKRIVPAQSSGGSSGSSRPFMFRRNWVADPKGLTQNCAVCGSVGVTCSECGAITCGQEMEPWECAVCGDGTPFLILVPSEKQVTGTEGSGRKQIAAGASTLRIGKG